jgi:hypothetical protein
VTAFARITHPAAATIVTISVPSKTLSARFIDAGSSATRLVSGARGRDHGSMRAQVTISSPEPACSCRRREALGGHNIAAQAFASCYATGRGWVLNGSQEM